MDLLADLGWVTLILVVLLSALFGLGRWEFGRIIFPSTMCLQGKIYNLPSAFSHLSTSRLTTNLNARLPN